MELFYFIVALLHFLHIPYDLFEDLTFDVIGYPSQYIPPIVGWLIDLWYQVNDLYI